ncbi:MONOTHIOL GLUTAREDOXIN-S6 [Salix purpurea]|uniref:MONOTHIOL GLUTAREDOXIN-S6 n=1 Tax=Salix purpurea TaxID=77065 RepID=A0A9Q0P253_SALPP|nr:MONOTHIOL GLUTAREDOXIN-S6 [Salix purpurea]
MDAVNSMIQEKPVVIFSKSSCCMSHSIESLMRGFGANPTIYQLDQIPNGQQIERELVVMSLLVQNQLVPLLKQAGAIWI